MVMTSAVHKANFIQRTRIARKASGVRVKTIALALGISAQKYRTYETDEVLPNSLLAGFAMLTRVSQDYLLTGHRSGTVDAQKIQSFNDISTPMNKCGAPCPYGSGWCRLKCSS